jgi:hypothetical protein
MSDKDTMARDLMNKLGEDLNALILRSVEIMLPELGFDWTRDIVLCAIAAEGEKVERDSDAKRGYFVSIVTRVGAEIERQRKAGRIN